jgi:hypothetical protein
MRCKNEDSGLGAWGSGKQQFFACTTREAQF